MVPRYRPAKASARARQLCERGLDGRIDRGSEQIAEIPPDPGRIVGLTAHARLLSGDGKTAETDPPGAPPEAVF